MARILVIANETIGGRALLDAVRKHVEKGDTQWFLCVPRMQPSHGSIIYDEAVYDAAQVRIDLARQFLRSQMGIEAVGEVGDPDPYAATMDAVGEFRPDEIIVSTKPATSSGWLRRDLVERIGDATGLPVEHVVTDIEKEGMAFTVTLVIANRTASTDKLLGRLREKAADGQHVFIVVVPQEGGQGAHAAAARGRLGQFLDRARTSGLVVAGMIGDPDPYTAAMNAIGFFHIDEIVISTLGEERSGWLRAHVVERIKRSTAAPVEHVVADANTAGVS